MARIYKVEVHDATRTVTDKHHQFPGGVKRRIAAFRVKSVAKNGELLQSSEVLNSQQAVEKHIHAMCHTWRSEGHINVKDCTAKKELKGISGHGNWNEPIKKAAAKK